VASYKLATFSIDEVVAMSGKADAFEDLIEVSRNGRAFYESAINAVSSPQLKALFSEMAQMKAGLVILLSSQTSLHGRQPANDSRFVSSFKELYEQAHVALLETSDTAYIQALEESEDQLLHLLEQAIHDAPELEAQPLVQGQLQKAKLCHDHLLELKLRLNVA
jgi:uncharacterized protein (TIGR02284 family)